MCHEVFKLFSFFSNRLHIHLCKVTLVLSRTLRSSKNMAQHIYHIHPIKTNFIQTLFIQSPFCSSTSHRTEHASCPQLERKVPEPTFIHTPYHAHLNPSVRSSVHMFVRSLTAFGSSDQPDPCQRTRASYINQG